MEGLAQVFISTVLFLNALAPQAQVPQVLGVKISDESVGTKVMNNVANTKSSVREQRLQEARTKRQESQDLLREKIDSQRRMHQSKREEFRNNLNNLRDDNRRKALENLDNKIINTNTRWTDHWMDISDRLFSILARAQSRVDKLEEQGVDVSQVSVLVVSAQSDIEIAQEIISDQAVKQYIIVVSDESGVRVSAQTQSETLKHDLTETMNSVSKARSSVRSVISALKTINQL